MFWDFVPTSAERLDSGIPLSFRDLVEITFERSRMSTLLVLVTLPRSENFRIETNKSYLLAESVYFGFVPGFLEILIGASKLLFNRAISSAI
jgi:hypothetical protein